MNFQCPYRVETGPTILTELRWSRHVVHYITALVHSSTAITGVPQLNVAVRVSNPDAMTTDKVQLAYKIDRSI